MNDNTKVDFYVTKVDSLYNISKSGDTTAEYDNCEPIF